MTLTRLAKVAVAYALALTVFGMIACWVALSGCATAQSAPAPAPASLTPAGSVTIHVAPGPLPDCEADLVRPGQLCWTRRVAPIGEGTGMLVAP